MTQSHGAPRYDTRAALLEAQAEACPRLERRAWPATGALEATGWMLALFLAAVAGDVSGSVVALVVWVVLAALAGWRTWRRVAELRAARAELRAWADADRTAAARLLRPAAVPHRLRTIFDARDADDLADVVGTVRLRAQERLYDGRLLVFGLALVPVLFVAALGLAIGLTGADHGAGAVLLTLTGVIAAVVSALLYGAWVAELWRRQQVLNRAGLEGQLYLSRRAATSGEQPEEPAGVPLAARLVAGLVGIGLVLLLVVRVLDASAAALLITLAVLVVGALLVAVPLVRARALHLHPLLAGDGSLLATRSPVEAHADAAGVHLRGAAGSLDVPRDQVVRVERVSLGYPFAPPAVAVIARDEQFVVAGTRATELLEAERLPA